MKKYEEKVYFIKSSTNESTSEKLKSNNLSIRSLLTSYLSFDSKLNRFIIFVLIFFSILIFLNVLYKCYKMVVCFKSKKKEIKSILVNIGKNSEAKKSLLIEKVDYKIKKNLNINQNNYQQLKEVIVMNSTDLSLNNKDISNKKLKNENFLSLLTKNYKRSVKKNQMNTKKYSNSDLPSILITDTNSMNTIILDLEVIK